MARPLKEGIDFFPLYTDFLQDAKLKKVRREHGSMGVTVYLSVICYIHDYMGYYAVYDEDLIDHVIQDHIGRYQPTEDVVRAVVETLKEYSLLQELTVGGVKMITAHRAQVNFYMATKRRKYVTVDKRIWMLSREEMEVLGASSPLFAFLVNVDNNAVNVNNNSVNASNNPQKEIEIEKEKEFHSINHSYACADELKLKFMGGDLGQGVVLISKEQFSHLCEVLSLDEIDKYMGIIVECEKSGKHFKCKSHYQAILDMAMKDRRVNS